PDSGHTFLTAGAGSGTGYVSAALSSDGKLGILYVPSTTPTLTVNMAKLVTTGQVTARWYDPTSGTFTAVTGSPFAASGSRTFKPTGTTSAGDGDWVLVLEAP